MRAYVATPGFEEALVAELGASGARVLVPGVVATDDDDALGDPIDPTNPTDPIDPIFARQLLPAAVEVTGTSVRALAEAAYAAVEGAVDRWSGAFTVHAFTPPTPPADDAPTVLPGARAAHTRAREARLTRGDAPSAKPGARDGGLGSRVALVERELLSLLAERRKRASRRHQSSVTPAGFDARLMLVQLLLVSRDRLVASAAAPRPLPRGGFDLAPWPAGAPPVDDDRAPPSRAYRKLEEAFQWMGVAPRTNETCVDLGAAPGSWTMMAARRGARVFAVDRAPLAPAARQGAVTSISGDAFAYEPPRPVDWLLSDIICEPARAITLVDDWLTAKRCRNLVVTIKFKGRGNYAALAALAPIFDRVRPAFARVKHLAHNKNEVTVMVCQR